MDVSAPYETVVPSLDGAVLTVLARAGKPLTGREIHRLSPRGSEQAVRNVVARLVNTGLVEADLVGSSTVYSANRDHIAWPVVDALVATNDLLVTRLRSTLSEWPVQPTHAMLFGSAARQDGGLESDIDVLLVHPDDLSEEQAETWDRRLADLHLAIEAWTGNEARLVDLDDTVWDRMGGRADPLSLSIATDGIDLLPDRHHQ